MTATRLYLSGGSHRAALGGIGAILYLLDSKGSFTWSDVDEIVAVSGGTQPVAALAAAQASDPAEVKSTMARLYRAILDDQLTLTTFRRRVILLNIAIAVLLPMLLWAAAALFFVPGFIAFPIGLVTIAVVYRVVSRQVSALQEDYLTSILRKAGTKPSHATQDLGTLTETKNLYVMLSAGLDSSEMYPAWIGEDPPLANSKRVIQSLSPVQACLVSSALPSLSRLKSPKSTSNGTILARRELLIDGGVGGNFGFQIAKQISDEIVTGAAANKNRRVLAIDAGRRAEPSTGVIARVRGVSTVARLARWLQLSGDATYLNDLDDVKELDSTLAGFVDVADGVNGKLIGSVVAQTSSSPKLAVETQKNAIKRNGLLGLFGLNDDTIHLAIACGVVGCLLTDRAAQANPTPVTEQEARAALGHAATVLGITTELSDGWSTP